MDYYRKSSEKSVLRRNLSLILIVGLALLLYIDNLNDKPKSKTKLLDVRENNDAINMYVDYITHNTDQMKPDHEYSSQALLKLLWATTAAADFSEVTLDGSAEKVTRYANNIMENPLKATHAYDIRKAADILSENLQKIQREHYPSLASEADNVKTAASQINPDILALQQKDAINNFFLNAGHLLEKIN
ncbi:hypothetical protein [Dyadobacter sp. LHD-138]|uniref:hypothetical protein n=1 Tax=Dyadobacter sp. LHD-138 TaxID=3071413 RepID=UPI0027E00D39|nr:hypothetical protein [Dyadobacter sp. LHD-138]MDQ6480561.1 hypothetical protein [Dyadobacter sp. LHD-138]